MLSGLTFLGILFIFVLVLLHLFLYKKCLVYRFFIQRVFKLSSYQDPNSSAPSFEMESSVWSNEESNV